MTPDVIIRTNRRSLSVTISKNGEVVVRAPKRLNINYIMSFLHDKEKWINLKKKEIEENQNKNLSVNTYKRFLFCGKSYNRVDIAKLKTIEISGSNILFPEGLTKQELINLSIKWYSGLTKQILTDRVGYFADIMHVNYNSVGIMNNKTRWGICTINGDLRFNYRISMLPHRTIDYIIIHELAHLVEFNHSPMFYRVVSSVMGDYKTQRKILNDNSYLLGLLRN